jgi:hypothetical protein
MIGAFLRRGLVAGALVGVLAGLAAQFVGEPSIDGAVAIEEAAAAANPEPAPAGPEEMEITRPTQKAGLVFGTMLVGLAVGSLFALAAAWAVGRVGGDGWTRNLKLGAAAAGALVLFPALKYPPNPPTVGDPATVGTRTTLYLGIVLLGLVLAALGWAGARQLAASRPSLPAPVRQTIVALALLVLGGLIMAGLPAAEGAAIGFPPELLWRFRLGSIGTQLILVLGIAVAFGLLTVRAERRARVPV